VTVVARGLGMDRRTAARGAGMLARRVSFTLAGTVVAAGALVLGEFAGAAGSPARAAVAEGTVRAVSAAASANLIRDWGAEQASPGSSSTKVPVPGWAVGKGDMFTVVAYGAAGGFPYAKSPGPKKRGRNFFAGGPGAHNSWARQTISLVRDKKAISAGRARFALGAYLGGFTVQGDYATLTVTWETAQGVVLGHATVGPVTEKQRKGVTGILPRGRSGKVPKSARLAVVTLTMVHKVGTYNDGYADNLSLMITA
jgi:hypothetical protein